MIQRFVNLMNFDTMVQLFNDSMIQLINEFFYVLHVFATTHVYTYSEKELNKYTGPRLNK